MKRLRTMFGVDDDLQEFANNWLIHESGCFLFAKSVCHVDGVMVATLYQKGNFQVELCFVPSGTVIPMHVHPHMDTIEVTVAGVLRLAVNGSDIYAGLSDEDASRLNKWRGIRINRDDVHGTVGSVGNGGALFLSIQKLSKAGASVLNNYVGAPLGKHHKEMIE